MEVGKEGLTCFVISSCSSRANVANASYLVPICESRTSVSFYHCPSCIRLRLEYSRVPGSPSGEAEEGWKEDRSARMRPRPSLQLSSRASSGDEQGRCGHG